MNLETISDYLAGLPGAAPLLIGCDLSKLDRFTTAILSNDEALAVAQARLAGRAAAAQAAGFLCGQAALLLVLLSAGPRPAYAVGMLFLTVAAFEAV